MTKTHPSKTLPPASKSDKVEDVTIPERDETLVHQEIHVGKVGNTSLYRIITTDNTPLPKELRNLMYTTPTLAAAKIANFEKARLAASASGGTDPK